MSEVDEAIKRHAEVHKFISESDHLSTAGSNAAVRRASSALGAELNKQRDRLQQLEVKKEKERQKRQQALLLKQQKRQQQKAEKTAAAAAQKQQKKGTASVSKTTRQQRAAAGMDVDLAALQGSDR